jgi:AcrR family transcriptional regulator
MNSIEDTALELSKRPRMRLSDDRARLLIDAAAGEFLSRGFRHGSVENIARVTGIGKATIYRHFTDKEGLFRATVLHLIDQLSVPPVDLTAQTGPPETVLFEFALKAMELFLRDRSIVLHRMVIDAGQNFPDLARLVHAQLTEWSLDSLKTYLAALTGRGLLPVADLDWAARQFLNLATHGVFFLVNPSGISLDQRRAMAAETVQLFLDGAGTMTGKL